MPLSAPFFFFFNDTATTEIYTLPLPAALPISVDRGVTQHVAGRQRGGHSAGRRRPVGEVRVGRRCRGLRELPIPRERRPTRTDRKSTRLNSSHLSISYAVICLDKKKTSRRCSN